MILQGGELFIGTGAVIAVMFFLIKLALRQVEQRAAEKFASVIQQQQERYDSLTKQYDERTKVLAESITALRGLQTEMGNVKLDMVQMRLECEKFFATKESVAEFRREHKESLVELGNDMKALFDKTFAILDVKMNKDDCAGGKICGN